MSYDLEIWVDHYSRFVKIFSSWDLERAREYSKCFENFSRMLSSLNEMYFFINCHSHHFSNTNHPLRINVHRIRCIFMVNDLFWFKTKFFCSVHSILWNQGTILPELIVLKSSHWLSGIKSRRLDQIGSFSVWRNKLTRIFFHPEKKWIKFRIFRFHPTTTATGTGKTDKFSLWIRFDGSFFRFQF